MLCKLLKNIYLNDIHKSLDSDEFFISMEMKLTFLDWGNNLDVINNYNPSPYFYPNSIFYSNNTYKDYLFELCKERDNQYRLYINISVIRPLLYKKHSQLIDYSKYSFIHDFADNSLIEPNEISDIKQAWRKIVLKLM